MDYHEASSLLEKPAVRLLRASHGAAILSFLIRTFKGGRRVTIPEGELRGLLETHLDSLSELGVEGFRENPVSYLDAWCDPRHGYLKKYWPDGATEPVFELTSGSENAIDWLEGLQSSEFVGTESRLQRIFDDLEHIIQFATPDVMLRLKALHDEVDRIQAQIHHIETTGELTVYTPAQINERYQLVLATARQLLGDFRQLEENFKGIGQQIAVSQSQPGANRGSIVSTMLDAYQALRDAPQGQSFYGFWHLLLAETPRAKFAKALEQISALDGLDPALKQDPLLRQLIGRLLLEGEKVVKSNERMASNLRRALEKTRQQERRMLLTIIQEIQALAIKVRSSPPQDPDFFGLEWISPIWGTMSREPWHPPESLTLEGDVEVDDGSLDLATLRRLSNMPQVQLRKLRSNVNHCLGESNVVTLGDVIRAFPPNEGLIEVIGYVIVADSDRRHIVSEEETETIRLRDQDWKLPFILFSRDA